MIVQLERIRKMNETFNLPSNDFVSDQGLHRLQQFQQVMMKELAEIEEISTDPETGEVDLVAVADLLTDILVYDLSEFRRWGIPVMAVFNAVMNSQDSKLVDGKPLMAEDGSKFIKGPNYEPPEPEIALIIEQHRKPA